MYAEDSSTGEQEGWAVIREIFDEQHLSELLEIDDWATLADFYSIFLEQISEFTAHRSDETAEVDPATLHHEAHRLSSSSSMIGAKELSSLFKQLEERCEAGADKENIGALMKTIDLVAAATVLQIQDYVIKRQ
jgi:HPt (histidine-containing phosphotransfer) domain-containing protein